MSKSQKGGQKLDMERIALNLRFFASFYPKYYFLETTLKQRLYQLTKREMGENWFTEQLNSSTQPAVIKAEAENIARRKPKDYQLRDTALLAESGLGMWVEFFHKDNYKLLKGLPILIFPKLPKEIKRKDLYKKLSRVKELRNQLFHHRVAPLTSTLQLENILEVDNDLQDLLAWLGISKAHFESENFKKDLVKIKKTLSA